MSTTQTDRLRALLDPLVSAAGAELEEVKVTAAGRRRQLLVVVDAEGGVPLDLVAELSRGISKALDDSDAMGGAPYILEVTSPGVDRPLTEPRHFARALGRMARIVQADGAEVTARITAVDDEGIDLQVPGVKGRRPTTRRLAYSEIAKARVEVEFNRPADSGSDDPDLADGTDEESAGAPSGDDGARPDGARTDGARRAGNKSTEEEA